MRNITSVMEYHAILGIDVGQDTLVVAALTHPHQDRPARLTVPNSPEGYQQLHQWCQTHFGTPENGVLVWVVEATGGLELPLLQFAHTHGYLPARVSTKAVNALGKARLRRAKTDMDDAFWIARWAWLSAPLRRWEPPLPELAVLRDWVRRRSELVRQRQAIKLRLRSARQRGVAPAVIASLEREWAFLSAEVKQAEQQVKAWLKAYPHWHALLQRWQTVVGVGLWTACLVLAEAGDLGRFEDGRALASFAGLVPAIRQSGRDAGVGRRLASDGNRRLRWGLYLAAQSAVRHRAHFRGIWARLQARGKARKVALCAVARRLVLVLYALWRDGTVWEEPCGGSSVSSEVGLESGVAGVEAEGACLGEASSVMGREVGGSMVLDSGGGVDNG